MFFFITIAAVILFYICLVRPFQFWLRNDIPQRSIFWIWKDTISLVFQLRPTGEIIRSYCEGFQNKRFCGAYQLFSHILYLTDPDLIKQITIQDFDHFVDHNQTMPEDQEPLWAKNLVSLKGDRWREMRATLSPSFTSSKMRAMFCLISDCSKQFVKFFKNGKEINHIDMKDVSTRFANDVIASAAFGITCNSLEEPNNEFYLMGKEATNFRGMWRALKFFLMMFTPKLVKILGIRLFSIEVGEFFRRLVRTNIESREKSGIVRPDMIHLLMQAKQAQTNHEANGKTSNTYDSASEQLSVGKIERILKQKLTNDDFTAQALIFFLGGFESVSNFMCFVFYELALNPDIQDKLREEVIATLGTCEGELNYDGLQKMKYMDMVLSETLRKWPPAIAIDRVCVKPYTIKPALEGEKEVDLKRGDVLWVPIYAIHRDPRHYSDPERFDPERFGDENKSNINSYTFIPFGLGPRNCIGNRFALLETKTLLFHVLYNFEIVVTKDTAIPLRLATNQFNLFSKDGFFFGLKLRQAINIKEV